MKICDSCGKPSKKRLEMGYEMDARLDYKHYDVCQSCSEDFVECVSDFFDHKQEELLNETK